MKSIRTITHPSLLCAGLLVVSVTVSSCHAAPLEPSKALPAEQANASNLEQEHSNALTQERISALPTGERARWQAYYDRSQAHLRADKAALAAELKVKGLKEATPAPYPSQGAPRVPEGVSTDWYKSAEGKAYVDSIVSYQIPSGGWSKALGFDKGPRTPGMHWSNKTDSWYYMGTFDNGSTTGQLITLARAYQIHKNPKYAAAFIKGLDYILDAQYPNGGWPQNYPLAGWYHDEITFNDDSMTHVVELARDVAAGKADYNFVDEARRAKARAAAEAGLRCILKTQFVQNGQLTAWCAQYDPLTLTPANARAFELASLSGWESASVVRFLMSIAPPTPEIKTAVDSAIKWFNAVKVTGYEVESGLNAVGGVTFTLKPNPQAGPLWARFYELGTNRPMFVTREPKVYYKLSDLDQSGPGRGYHWYVNQPQKLLERDYPKWKSTWETPNGTPKVEPEGLLPARIASIQGGRAVLEDGENIGYWDSTDTRISWQKELKPGQYTVAINYALDGRQAGSELEIQVGEQRLKLTPTATSGWSDYRSLQAGTVTLERAETTQVQVRALSKPHEFVANLRGVTLTPVK